MKISIRFCTHVVCIGLGVGQCELAISQMHRYLI